VTELLRAPDPRSTAIPVPKWALALPVLVVVAVTAAAVAMITVGRSPQTVSVSGGVARVGARAPNFASWDLNGKKVSLANFKGRPMLLTFWATWCTACREELPALQGIQDRYQSTGFTILAINYRETDNRRLIQYLAGLHVNLEGVVDPDGTIAAAYGVTIGLPVNVLLDRAGTVVQVIIGQVPSATLESAVSQISNRQFAVFTLAGGGVGGRVIHTQHRVRRWARVPQCPIMACIIAGVPSLTNPLTSSECARMAFVSCGSFEVSVTTTPLAVSVNSRR
jgi:thiol-disulfide isomerase/thioredoxin